MLSSFTCTAMTKADTVRMQKTCCKKELRRYALLIHFNNTVDLAHKPEASNETDSSCEEKE